MKNLILENSRLALSQAIATLRDGNIDAAKAQFARLPAGLDLARAVVDELGSATAANLSIAIDRLRRMAGVGQPARGIWNSSLHPRWPAGDPQGRGGQLRLQAEAATRARHRPLRAVSSLRQRPGLVITAARIQAQRLDPAIATELGRSTFRERC